MTTPPPAVRAGALVPLASVTTALGLSMLTVVVDVSSTGAERAAAGGMDLGWTTAVAGLALVLPGAVLLRRVPSNPVGWVLTAAGQLWVIDGLAAAWLVRATAADPPLAGASLSFWVYHRLGAWLLLTLPLVLLLFPDGRLPEGRWRAASVVSLGLTSLVPLLNLVVPADVAQARGGDPLPEPFRGLPLDQTALVWVPVEVWEALQVVAFAAVPLSLCVPFAVVVRRYRAAAVEGRRRLRWLLWAGLVDLLVMVGAASLPAGWTSVGLVVAVSLTGTAVAVGIARPGLADVDRLLSGTVVYALLAGAVVLLDVVVVGTVGVLVGGRLDERSTVLVAVGIVAAAYVPVRDRLWRLVRRLVLGERHDPYGVLAALAERLEGSDAPDEQPLAVAQSVAVAFRLPYVGVEVDHGDGGTLLAEHGTPPARTRALPVSYRGEHVGRLLLAVDGASARLAARDERLLGDVVRQTAAAARASRLAAELQHSRELLVATREEERRRLRRDLHDGLGPALGAVVLRIDTARNLTRRDPAAADEVLLQARDDVAGAVAELRRVVHDLRPPALDDRGLVGALEQRAAAMSSELQRLDVSAPAPLPELPAAVEVAAYRIASEAMANVTRHSAASRGRVCLGVDGDALVVEVTDDGAGIPVDAVVGVGLVSLRERAAELGGRSEVLCPAEGGTTVRAWLPLARPHQARAGRGAEAEVASGG